MPTQEGNAETARPQDALRLVLSHRERGKPFGIQLHCGQQLLESHVPVPTFQSGPVSVVPGLAILGLFLAFLFTGPIQGPLFAFIQDVVPSELHSRASAVTFFMTSALGLGLGTLLIGYISDRLGVAHGGESLRHALVPVVASSGLLSVISCLGAAFFVRGPKDPNENPT